MASAHHLLLKLQLPVRSKFSLSDAGHNLSPLTGRV